MPETILPPLRGSIANFKKKEEMLR